MIGNQKGTIIFEFVGKNIFIHEGEEDEF